MNAALTERLVAIAQAARGAAHGGRGAIYRKACKELGMSYATLQRKLKEVCVRPERKKRKDAGQTSLSRKEALKIAALLKESLRKNGKQLMSVGRALEILRSNGQIRAEYVDTETGEIRPLSESTVHRALRQYGLHPDQLNAPAPVTELQSLHPNHVWEIDASLCTLYYLSNGVQGMPAEVYYKNKPANSERIAANRVWRYVITDHTSGWLYVEYVLGAESGENLCHVLINAMQERAGQDIMHGVPKMLMLDPGAANTAGMTKNLCHALGIVLQVNKPGNARAKGQVENANELVETQLEPGLKLQCVNGLDALNDIARRWRIHFNATRIHSRTGRTRHAVWMTIRPDQLVKAPSMEICRELAVAQPESRKVSPTLQISFGGKHYDVSSVPGIMVGEKVMVTRNPWREDAAQIVLVDENGREVFHVVHEIERNEYGFRTDAAIIGESYKRHAETPTQKAAAEIEKLVTETDRSTDAEQARKTGKLPFGGKIDPFRHIDETSLPSWLPRRGTAHALAMPKVEFPPLSHVEAAKQLRQRLAANGYEWTAETFAWLRQRYPESVPQSELDGIVTRLTRQSDTPVSPLKVSGGRP